VFEHLFALVVSQRLLEFAGDGAEGAGIGFAYCDGALVSAKGNQEGVAGGALNQGAKRAFLVQSHNEIAFPMSGNGTVGNFTRPFLNGEHISDFASLFLGIPAFLLSAILALLPQGLDKRLPQRTPGKHVQLSIDGLMRDAHGHI